MEDEVAQDKVAEDDSGDRGEEYRKLMNYPLVKVFFYFDIYCSL
jgi:hypothetical protein